MPLPDGFRKQQSLKTPNKTEAGAIAGNVYRRYYRTDVPDTLDTLIAAFENHEDNSHQHLAAKMKTIRRFCRQCDIVEPVDITTRAVNKYLDMRKKDGLAAKARINERGHLGRFCDWLVKSEGVLEFNPVPGSDRPIHRNLQKIVHLSEDELAEAIKFATENKKWAILIAIYTGLRVSEIKRIQWEDIGGTKAKPTLMVRGKTGEHAIPLHPELPKVFKSIPRTGKTVFPKRTPRWWYVYLEPLRKHIPKMDRIGGGWHDFRRTLGSLMVQSGVDMARVSKLLRHSNITTTAKYYAHLTAEDGRDAMDGYARFK